MVVLKVAGLDLAAKENRCSGFALIECKNNYCELVELKCLGDDEEIIGEVSKSKVNVIAIDAPLTNNPRMRYVDKLMIKRGFRVLPPSLPWMKMLSLRAYRIYLKLLRLGIHVIETHPRSALLCSGATDVMELLDSLGVNYSKFKDVITRVRDLRDAVIASLVALCYIKNCYEVVSCGDGAIYLIKNITLIKGHKS